MLGDSITAGQGANLATESYPAVLRSLLTASGVLPSNGTGWVLAHSADSGYDPRTSRTGTWTKFADGQDRKVLVYAPGGGGTYTFASDVAGTIVDVKYSNISSPFTVSIDGGSAVTVTPAGGATLGTYTVTGLSNATHTIVVTTVAGTVYLAAFQVRTTSGLRVSNLGLGGAKGSDVICGGQPFGSLAFCTSDAPDLVVLGLMTSKAYLGQTAATYETNLISIITALKAAGCDILLDAQIPAGGNSLAGTAMDLTPYRARLYSVAYARSLPVLDLTDRWGSYAAANTLGQMSDIFHPTAIGYRDYARGQGCRESGPSWRRARRSEWSCGIRNSIPQTRTTVCPRRW